MRWLITGGCGFIGTSLIDRLTNEGGHTIRVVDNLSGGSRSDLARVSLFVEAAPSKLGPIRAGAAPVELVVGDVRDEALALAAANDAEIIVHLAANTGVEPSINDPRADCVTNVMGTLNYLEAARQQGSGRFVFASSGAPIGECEPPIHEELAAHPVSPYGASKLAGEGYCSAYARSYDVDTVALRFGNVYGPGSGHKTSVVAKFIRRARAGEVLEIYGDGGQTRDFIYIDDLVRAIRLAATVEGIAGEVFQIATAAETTVSELVEMLTGTLEAAGLRDIARHNAAPRLGDVRRNFSDTAKARRLLGWQAETALGDGLKRTVDWFLHRAPIASAAE
jgi:UDP-glucose 4-epimerase